MEFRRLTPYQRALGEDLRDLRFLTCVVCKNTTMFSLHTEVELVGHVEGGGLVIDDITPSAHKSLEWQYNRLGPNSQSHYSPPPATLYGSVIRCSSCSHPVWHQQDVISYHRMMYCTGCDLCGLEDREKLLEICGRCRTEHAQYDNWYTIGSQPDCEECVHGPSRELLELDRYESEIIVEPEDDSWVEVWHDHIR